MKKINENIKIEQKHSITALAVAQGVVTVSKLPRYSHLVKAETTNDSEVFENATNTIVESQEDA